jgi:DNA-binding CsgD family transcriptional regulator
MLEALVAQLASSSLSASRREEGVAFFGVAKDLYRLSQITYVCVNLPVAARSRQFTHCIYSDTAISHYLSQQRIDLEPVNVKTVSAANSCELQHPSAPSSEAGVDAVDAATLEFAIPPRRGETALLAMRKNDAGAEWQEQKHVLIRECRILANYFHGHILRINGHNSEEDILISARELDCLKWTAAGKTAWEASVILGISERTVRFHLNAAREKLNCATTTQAVAKAIANQLIDI